VLDAADAIIFGCPTYMGNVVRRPAPHALGQPRPHGRVEYQWRK
jgi:hypothetical protein